MNEPREKLQFMRSGLYMSFFFFFTEKVKVISALQSISHRSAAD